MTLSSLSKALDAILAVVWAPRCAACERPLESPTRGIVCAACWRRVPCIAAPVCERCGVGITRADAVSRVLWRRHLIIH